MMADALSATASSLSLLPTLLAPDSHFALTRHDARIHRSRKSPIKGAKGDEIQLTLTFERGNDDDDDDDDDDRENLPINTSMRDQADVSANEWSEEARALDEAKSRMSRYIRDQLVQQREQKHRAIALLQAIHKSPVPIPPPALPPAPVTGTSQYPFESQVSVLESKLSAKERELNAVITEHQQQTHNDNHTYQSTIDKLQREIQSLTRRCDDWKRRHTELHSDLSSKESQLAALSLKSKQSSTQRDADYDRLTDENQSLRSSLTDRDAVIGDLQTQQRKSRTAQNALNESMESLQHELKSVRQQHEREQQLLQDRIEQLTTELQSARQQHDDQQAKIDTLIHADRTGTNLREQLASLSDQLSHVRAELVTKSDRVQFLESETEILQERAADMLAETDRLSKENLRLLNDKSISDREHAALNVRYEHAVQQLNDWKQQRVNDSSEMARLQLMIDGQSKKEVLLQQQVETMNRTNATNHQLIAEQEQRIEWMMKLIESLQAARATTHSPITSAGDTPRSASGTTTPQRAQQAKSLVQQLSSPLPSQARGVLAEIEAMGEELPRTPIALPPSRRSTQSSAASSRASTRSVSATSSPRASDADAVFGTGSPRVRHRVERVLEDDDDATNINDEIIYPPTSAHRSFTARRSVKRAPESEPQISVSVSVEEDIAVVSDEDEVPTQQHRSHSREACSKQSDEEEDDETIQSPTANIASQTASPVSTLRQASSSRDDNVSEEEEWPKEDDSPLSLAAVTKGSVTCVDDDVAREQEPINDSVNSSAITEDLNTAVDDNAVEVTRTNTLISNQSVSVVKPSDDADESADSVAEADRADTVTDALLQELKEEMMRDLERLHQGSQHRLRQAAKSQPLTLSASQSRPSQSTPASRKALVALLLNQWIAEDIHEWRRAESRARTESSEPLTHTQVPAVYSQRPSSPLASSTGTLPPFSLPSTASSTGSPAPDAEAEAYMEEFGSFDNEKGILDVSVNSELNDSNNDSFNTSQMSINQSLSAITAMQPSSPLVQSSQYIGGVINDVRLVVQSLVVGAVDSDSDSGGVDHEAVLRAVKARRSTGPSGVLIANAHDRAFHRWLIDLVYERHQQRARALQQRRQPWQPQPRLMSIAAEDAEILATVRRALDKRDTATALPAAVMGGHAAVLTSVALQPLLVSITANHARSINDSKLAWREAFEQQRGVTINQVADAIAEQLLLELVADIQRADQARSTG